MQERRTSAGTRQVAQGVGVEGVHLYWLLRVSAGTESVVAHACGEVARWVSPELSPLGPDDCQRRTKVVFFSAELSVV